MRFKDWLESFENSSPNGYQAFLQMQQNYRQNLVDQGKVAGDLQFFKNYQQIKQLLLAMAQENRRHRLWLNYITPKLATQESNMPASLYHVERDIIDTQNMILKNRHDLHTLWRQAGIDMNKHFRRWAGMRENSELTSDYTSMHSTPQSFYTPSYQNQSQPTAGGLQLDGQQVFPGGMQQIVQELAPITHEAQFIAQIIGRMLATKPPTDGEVSYDLDQPEPPSKIEW